MDAPLGRDALMPIEVHDSRVFANEVKEAGLEDVPAFLEIIHPFELADEVVLKSITTSVLHCRREYAREQFAEKQLA